MSSLLDILVTNAATAGALAVVAVVMTRSGRRPAVSHVLWALVLLRLVMPPIVPCEVLPITGFDDAKKDAASTPSPPSLPVSILAPAWWPPMVEAPAAVTSVFDPRGAEATGTAPTVVESAQSASMPPLLPRWAWAWLLGTVVVLSIALTRAFRFRRVLRHARQAPEPIIEVAREIAVRLGLRRCPAIVLVDASVPPLVWGFLCRARVLLPSRLLSQIDADELHGLLAHELAHVKRRDHWMRYLELITTAAWWWLPLTWWARRRLREAEELCCDQWAVWCAPDAREAYATALLRTVTFLSRSRGRIPAPAVGMSVIPGVKRRLGMILENQDRAPALRRTTLLVCLALPVFALLPAPAQEHPQEAPRKAVERTIDLNRVPAVERPLVDPGAVANLATRELMDTTTMSVSLVDATLEEFVKLLSAQGGIKVVIESDLARAKLHEPLTMDFESVPLRTALDHVCKVLEMDFALDHGIVHLRKREVQEKATVQVYEVADLAGGNDEGTRRIATMVMRNVSPKTWMTSGHKVTPHKTHIWISAPRKTHRQVARFLNDLRMFTAAPGADRRWPPQPASPSSEELLRREIDKLKARQHALQKRIEELEPGRKKASDTCALRLRIVDGKGQPLQGIGIDRIDYRTEKRTRDGRLVSVQEARDPRARGQKSDADGRLELRLRAGQQARITFTDGRGGTSGLTLATGDGGTAIDSHVVFRSNTRHLPDADREALIRRVTLDLTGLPPTTAEIETLLADDAPKDRIHVPKEVPERAPAKEPKLRKKLRGRITKADPKTGDVFLNVGSSQGVRKNDVLDVIRGNTYIGRLTVLQVEKNHALGTMTLIAAGNTVKAGDTVLNDL